MAAALASTNSFICTDYFLLLLLVLLSFLSGQSCATTANINPETVIVGRATWKLTESNPSPNTLLQNVKVALVQRNLPLLENMLNEISNPSSDRYAQYLSVGDLTRLIAPTDEEIQAVESWIVNEAKSSALNVKLDLSVNKDYIFLSAPLALVERLFKVKIYQFTRMPAEAYDEENDRETLPKLVYRGVSGAGVFIPEDLRGVVAAVFGVLDFPAPVRDIPHRQSTKVAEPGNNITPPVIKSLYKIDRKGQSQLSQAVAEFEQAYFYPSDVLAFEKLYNLPQQPIAKIIGPNHPDTGYLGEASLDTQYIIGVATGVPSWVFSIGQNGLDLITWANLVMNTTAPPLVHSISWGSGESGWDKSLMQRINTEFMKLGLLGMSVFVASGDDGTGNTGLFYCGTFDPTFPASSPYVTTVGGTYLTTGEAGWSSSGGGFSTLFQRPSYQNAAVSNYLQNGPNMPSTDYFNSAGRGFPDVAALSTNFQVIIANFSGPISGTSAATPTFAAVVSLLNDARYTLMKKKPLGFINPWLYQLGQVGTDIVQGDNKVWLCSEGFTATTGWDAITGLGTPDFQYLLKAALALP